MSGSNIARVYAEGLFELAKEKGRLDETAQELHLLAELVRTDLLFRRFLLSPGIPVPKKRETLRKLFSERVSPMLMNFLGVLLKKRRQGFLVDIEREFHERLDESKNQVHGRLTLASESANGVTGRLEQALGRHVRKTVLLEKEIDPEILGGATVRIGDLVVDGSVRSSLERLKKKLLNKGRVS